MGRQEHPELGLLLRFLRGEASPAEARAIVRHLLAGCGRCGRSAVPELGFVGGMNEMTTVDATLASVRELLRAWIVILEAAHSGLLGLAAAVPASPDEADPAVDLDVMDERTELRSVLRNVAEDDLRPAIQDMRDLLPKEEM